jgi:hypothetical protein
MVKKRKTREIKMDCLQANTSALEAQIDSLVYKLYGLMEEEIAVVEGQDE